jgi:hypothetical protein
LRPRGAGSKATGQGAGGISTHAAILMRGEPVTQTRPRVLFTEDVPQLSSL